MEKSYHVYESNIHKPLRVTVIGRSRRRFIDQFSFFALGK